MLLTLALLLAGDPHGPLKGSAVRDLATELESSRLLLAGPVPGTVFYKPSAKQAALEFPERVKNVTQRGRILYVTEKAVVVRGFSNEPRLFRLDDYADVYLLWDAVGMKEPRVIDRKDGTVRFRLSSSTLPHSYAMPETKPTRHVPRKEEEAYFVKSVARLLAFAQASVARNDGDATRDLMNRGEVARTYAERNGFGAPARLVGDVLKNYAKDALALRAQQAEVWADHLEASGAARKATERKVAAGMNAYYKNQLEGRFAFVKGVAVSHDENAGGLDAFDALLDVGSSQRNTFIAQAQVKAAQQEYSLRVKELDAARRTRLAELQKELTDLTANARATMAGQVKAVAGLSEQEQFALAGPLAEVFGDRALTQTLADLEARHATARDAGGLRFDANEALSFGYLRAAIRFRDAREGYREWEHADRTFAWAQEALEQLRNLPEDHYYDADRADILRGAALLVRLACFIEAFGLKDGPPYSPRGWYAADLVALADSIDKPAVASDSAKRNYRAAGFLSPPRDVRPLGASLR